VAGWLAGVSALVAQWPMAYQWRLAGWLAINLYNQCQSRLCVAAVMASEMAWLNENIQRNVWLNRGGLAGWRRS
jgi:hypothetical protein